VEEARPTAAFVVSLLGGLLMFIEGVVLSIASSIASSLGLFAAGSVLSGLGFLGGIFGFLVIVLSIQLFRHPDSHKGYSIAILVVSLLSVFGGGGFILGLVLGLIGAVLGLLFSPEEPMISWEGEGRLARPAPATKRASCWSCEAPLPYGATKCPNCGVAVGGS
jgi:MFS family permease